MQGYYTKFLYNLMSLQSIDFRFWKFSFVGYYCGSEVKNSQFFLLILDFEPAKMGKKLTF